MDNNLIFSVRTDMADEARRLWHGSAKDNDKLPGVNFSQKVFHGLELSEIHIMDELGEQALGKARGHYYSLYLPKLFDRGAENFYDIVTALSELIQNLVSIAPSSVLIAALGNPDITPDALGNFSASSILVTRHLDLNQFTQFNAVSVCRPGVLGTSGIESAAQIKAMVELIKPELLIVIDALAGAEADRLCRCIQLSDAGISPGSGVGNDRPELSRASLGLPVISIGIPTVIDASHFGGECCKSMFVTPRDIDALVRAGGRLIAYGINLAVHNGININDVDALIG